jgi:hypothetical protein
LARAALGAAASGANTDITSLASPALGSATATTQARGTNNTDVATTAFVTRQSPFVNILDYGGDNTGVSDNVAAFNAAIAACTSHEISIYFPRGFYKFASGPTITLSSSQTNPASISIRGEGSGITKFVFSGVGILIKYDTAFCSSHIEGISFLTTTAGGTYGLFLEQIGTVASGGFGANGLTTLRDLEFRGSDGWNENFFWGAGLTCAGASNINCYDCTFYGCTGTPSGAGVVLDYAPNDHTLIPIVFNMMGCSFTHLQSGLIYGGNWQGISVLYCNFTANFDGIIVPNTAFANDQLLVNSCQFNNINHSIVCAIWCQAVSIVNNFFLVTDNQIGIDLVQMSNTSIVGNIFSTGDGTPVNQIGIQIATNAGGAAGVITGNQFNGLTTAVVLTAASSGINVQSNCYQGNGTNVSNAGVGNTLGGVTGATN